MLHDLACRRSVRGKKQRLRNKPWRSVLFVVCSFHRNAKRESRVVGMDKVVGVVAPRVFGMAASDDSEKKFSGGDSSQTLEKPQNGEGKGKKRSITRPFPNRFGPDLEGFGWSREGSCPSPVASLLVG